MLSIFLMIGRTKPSTRQLVDYSVANCVSVRIRVVAAIRFSVDKILAKTATFISEESFRKDLVKDILWEKNNFQMTSTILTQRNVIIARRIRLYLDVSLRISPSPYLRTLFHFLIACLIIFVTPKAMKKNRMP